MLLVYTHKITPRLTYVFKHICGRMLGMSVGFTNKVEEVVAHDGPKLSYTHKRLGNELHIKSSELLFEQGIMDAQIKMGDWEGIPAFFTTSEASVLPYDIFAASFYLLSRYEEYLPHVKDDLGRYPATESLAYAHKFLDTPIIDVWVQRFRLALQIAYPDAVFTVPKMKSMVLIEVAQAFAFKKLGFLRTVAGFWTDFFKFRLKRNFTRFNVLLGLRKDPSDTFTWLNNVQKQSAIPFQYFFELGDFSQESRNIKYSKATFQSLIKMVGDYSRVGLLISQLAGKQIDQLKVEKGRLEGIVNRNLKSVQVAHKLLQLPDTYRNSIDQEITEDYSMAYAKRPGFRAGTCTPFLFYDLDYEIQTPLLLYPLCIEDHQIVDGSRGIVDTLTFEALRTKVRAVGGVFVVGFSNTSFTNMQSKELFKKIVFHEAD